MIGIYKITSPTDKVYIGQSRHIRSRGCRYKNLHCKEQPRIYNSLKKYGWDAHTFEVILPMHHSTTQKWLDFWEQYWMDHYRAEGYELMNLKEGGSSGSHSEETKQKISTSLKGNKHTLGNKLSEEHKKKIGIGNKGKKLSVETKKRISISKQGSNNPMFNKVGYLSPSFGKKLSEETKKKISISKSGKKYSDEYREKMSNFLIGKGVKPILQLSLEGVLIREWSSATEANKQLEISYKNISSVCYEKRKTAGGFIWKFKESK